MGVQFWILDRIRRVVMNKLVLITFAILAIVCCGSEAAKGKGRTGRRLTQGLKLSLALERKLMECLEKSLDPCEIDGKEYSMDQVKAALPQIKTENGRQKRRGKSGKRSSVY